MNENFEKILSDCRPDWAFWTCNGTVIRNLHELKNTIEGLNDWGFTYHVNKDKDDFAKWVGEVIGDERLSKTLAHIKDKQKYLHAIARRLGSLEKDADRAMHAAV